MGELFQLQTFLFRRNVDKVICVVQISATITIYIYNTNVIVCAFGLFSKVSLLRFIFVISSVYSFVTGFVCVSLNLFSKTMFIFKKISCEKF